ncbi:MAG: ATP synthase F1 subunit gamma [Thermodesulfobacteriota bacterium]
MATLSDIKRRIKSVKNTQQITKAMKMVSAAKLRRAQEEIVAARPYAEKMVGLITSLASKASPDSHPLLSIRPGNKVGVVLITSDRGLCGGFNSTLIRTVERLISEKSGSEVRLYLMGRRASEHFKRRAKDVLKSGPLAKARPDYPMAAGAAADLTGAYLAEELDEVYLVYSEFKSALSQIPVVQQLLPVSTGGGEETAGVAGEEGGGEYLYEPSEGAVLASLLPKYVEVQLFRALLESAASEHGARMTAMDSASKNAAEMIGALTLQYNRVRQAAITKELMEIIGGAEALK